MPTVTTKCSAWPKTTEKFTIDSKQETMALGKDKGEKLYYLIKEVALEIGVSESTLRYWESEFPQISPKKSANNVRRYTKEDIKKIRLIYHLVKERGLTLAGARKYLKTNGNHEIAENTSNVVERLKSIRSELVGMRDALKNL